MRNNVIHRWGVYDLRARAGSSGNVMHNFFGRGANPKKRQDAVFVLMKKGEAKAVVGAVHVAGDLGPGQLNLNSWAQRSSPSRRRRSLTGIPRWPAGTSSSMQAFARWTRGTKHG